MCMACALRRRNSATGAWGSAAATPAEDSIAALNAAFAPELAEHPSTHIVDLRPLLRGGDGYLRAELSYDGLHLDAQGYALWRDAIAPNIAPLTASAAMGMAVWGALAHNPVLAARYAHLTGRDRNQLTDHQARAALAASLLRWLWVVATKRIPWDAQVASGALDPHKEVTAPAA